MLALQKHGYMLKTFKLNMFRDFFFPPQTYAVGLGNDWELVLK